MSYDPNQATQDPNAPPSPNHQTPPKRGKKWWFLGGFGCVGVIGICCVGGFISMYIALVQPMQSILIESREYARTSEVVQQALGEIGETIALAETQDPAWPTTRTEGQLSIQEYRYPCSGSKAKGELIVELSYTPSLEFERHALRLELEDGTVIDLDAEDELDFEIDLGGDPVEGNEDAPIDNMSGDQH